MKVNHLKSIIIIVLAIVTALMFMSERDPVKPKIITRTNTIYSDTLITYLWNSTINIKEQATVHDTVYIDSSGDSIKTRVAELDTVFDSGSELDIRYFMHPNVFEVDFSEAPIKTITVTDSILETVYVDSSLWWNKAWIGAGATVVMLKILQGIL